MVLSAVDLAARLHVRVAGTEDVPTITGLRRRLTEEQAGGPVDDGGFADSMAAWFERERHQRVTWLADLDGRPIGMLNMVVFTRMPKPRSAAEPGSAGQWGYVANVYVEPDHRGHGIGRALLDRAVQHADRHGFARLVLAPSERSVPFYERAGFGPATSLMVRPGR